MMSPPPFLMASALLFWGWQTHMEPLALGMAVLLEFPRYIKTRWDISSSDFTRVSDFCALLIIGASAYLFMIQQTLYVVVVVMKSLPIAFFPLLFAQNISTQQSIDIRTISILLRMKRMSREDSLRVNLSYPYVILAVLSASFANERGMGFYWGILGLAFWPLFRIRPDRYSRMIWLGLFAASALTGYGIQQSLERLTAYLETKGAEWFYNVSRETDPFHSSTAIGAIADLKPSHRILFRVFPDHPSHLPLLLREASYNRYRGNEWLAVNTTFSPVFPEPDNSTWNLGPPPRTARWVEVATDLPKGSGVLKLPMGTFRVRELPVVSLSRNGLGAVKTESGPEWLAYRADFGNPTPIDDPPTKDDLTVPKKDSGTVEKVVQSLGLKNLPPEPAIAAVEAFFEAGFTYSLTLKDSGFSTPLRAFLETGRSGHCEYFATATVLILRAGGIPARYATGFSVHEWNDFEECVRVRDRHAHAWVLAWVGGAWRSVDTTPSIWR